MSPELNSEESLEASQVTGAVKNGCGWRLPISNRYSPDRFGSCFIPMSSMISRSGFRYLWSVRSCPDNVDGTFYYLTSILDGYSRAIVYWELGETMKEQEIEVHVQKA